jgi:hypothetical protein
MLGKRADCVTSAEVASDDIYAKSSSAKVAGIEDLPGETNLGGIELSDKSCRRRRAAACSICFRFINGLERGFRRADAIGAVDREIR